MKGLTRRERKIENIKRDEGKKYILFLLDSLEQEPIRGTTKLMKELFFISNNVPILKNILKFEPDNFGPSSDVVSRYLENLALSNIIHSKKSSKSSKVVEYSLTELGKDIVDEVKNEEFDAELISDMKELFHGLTYDETLALTYFSFPEMTTESLIKKKIYNKRKKLALSLYKKEKVSLSKASYIAGMPLISFLELLKNNGINVELSI